MHLKKGEILELEVENLAYGGKGVAKKNGFVFFIDSGLPKDKVKAVVRKIKGNYAEAKLLELISPSPHRIKASCEHFEYCGGCKWQNLEYAVQKKYKEDQLRQALIHVGGIPDPPVEPIIGAHKIYFYRNKMEFSFHIGNDSETILGLHKAGRFEDVFQLRFCHLQSETSNEIVKFVRQRCVELGLPPYHIVKHEGFTRFLVIREGKFTDQTLINIVTATGSYDGLRILAEEIKGKFPKVMSISHTVNPHKANIARGEKQAILFGSDHIYEKLGEKKYRISANSFFQTNSYQTQRLYDLAVELAQPESSDQMLDLYTGTGTIAIYFSGLVKEVTGVETVEEAIEDAFFNAKINSASNCRFVKADVADYLKEIVNLGKKFDLLIIDPPRAGCHPNVIKSIIAMKTKKLVYISCNPATLARDVKTLTENGYVLDRALAVDLFPHTHHIESALRLTLKE